VNEYDFDTLYFDIVECESSDPYKIDWESVRDNYNENDFIDTFERALCEKILEEIGDIFVRRRIFGWCGTAYERISDFLKQDKLN
jgi:hypothetical protein